ncbi:MAG TPA: response regulator [Bryobacteraceae bacterium]|nr:response regulator [Bryobacteraceae bacterium]
MVEDNPGDVRLMKEVLKAIGFHTRLAVVEDGEKAMEYLRQPGSPPAVIFLDLNLPRKDGRQVLAEIKTDPVLKRIPVIILTTSEASLDVQRAYDLQANCYIHKPSDFDKYIDMIRSCQRFWFQVVRLPTSVQALA